MFGTEDVLTLGFLQNLAAWATCTGFVHSCCKVLILVASQYKFNW